MEIISEIQKKDVQVDLNNGLPSVKDTKELIDDLHKSAIVSEVKNNQDIQDKFVSQARKSVGNELYSINQENVSRRQKTTYDANREACKLYGIDEHVPLWQIRLMKFGSSIWFIVYWIFATLTIAPINIFFKGIKSFIKNSFLVFIIAVLCYLIIVIGIPLIISLI